MGTNPKRDDTRAPVDESQKARDPQDEATQSLPLTPEQEEKVKGGLTNIREGWSSN
jgi:hypothetical protein